MSEYVDLTRLTQLEEIMGTEAPSMVAAMVSSVADAIEHLEATVGAGELEPAIQAAHTARNDALMLGAEALQEALQELEAAAREADEVRTRQMLERVREVWPPTRAELARL